MEESVEMAVDMTCEPTASDSRLSPNRDSHRVTESPGERVTEYRMSSFSRHRGHVVTRRLGDSVTRTRGLPGPAESAETSLREPHDCRGIDIRQLQQPLPRLGRHHAVDRDRRQRLAALREPRLVILRDV